MGCARTHDLICIALQEGDRRTALRGCALERVESQLFLVHVPDGEGFSDNVTYQFEEHENVPQPLRSWMKTAFEGRIVPATEALGNLLTTYMEFRDNRDPVRAGVEGFIGTPRFATGYAPLRNRPALLIETHMLKDYRTRVRANYDLLRRFWRREPRSGGLDTCGERQIKMLSKRSA